MFNPKTALRAAPNFWVDRFEDINIIEDLFSYVGTYLGDVYGDMLLQPANYGLLNVPTTSFVTWRPLELSASNRLFIGSTSSISPITIYGVDEEDSVLISCARIYGAPTSESGEYLQYGRDFLVFNRFAREIQSLRERTRVPQFFDRYSKFIVFVSGDPASSIAQLEPDSPLYGFPLVLRVSEADITLSQDELYNRTFDIAAKGTSFSGRVLLATTVEDDTIDILLSTECFYPFNKGDSATITGEDIGTVEGRWVDPYYVSLPSYTVWGFSCEIDQLTLYRRFGHLVLEDRTQDSAPVLSSENYRELLYQFLQTRMHGLSSKRAEDILNIAQGGTTLEFDTNQDPIRTLDMLLGEVRTDRVTYSITEPLHIKTDIVASCDSFRYRDSFVTTDRLIAIAVEDVDSYAVIAAKLGTDRVSVGSSDGTELGTIAVLGSYRDVIVELGDSISLEQISGRLTIAGSDGALLGIPESLYSARPLIKPSNISSGTPFTDYIEVHDISSSRFYDVAEGAFLPRTILDVSEPDRREISSKTFKYVVGSMPRHRVGDYRLAIPPEASSSAACTAKMLFEDFLTTKVAWVDLVSGKGSADVDLSLLDSNRDRSKLLLSKVSKGVADFIKSPTDTLDITIEISLQTETLIAQSYEGIGSLGVTLELSGNTVLPIGDTVRVVMLSPDTIEQDGIVIGTLEGSILVELQSGSSGWQLASAVSIDGAEYTVNKVTNVVGGDTPLMVSGASYPEYTPVANLTPNTIAEHLDVDVE